MSGIMFILSTLGGFKKINYYYYLKKDSIWWIILLITTMVEMIPNHLGYWLDTYIKIQIVCEFIFNASAQILNVGFKFGDA